MERLGIDGQARPGESLMAGQVRPLQDAISTAKARRNALAGCVKAALLELERTPVGTSPTPAARHERQCLADALAALLRQAPEPACRGIDAEVASSLRCLDEELELAK